ncbi:hypothetical protein SAMN05444745_11115 [Arthrobacter sp. OV608]|nr:hypothetical protein SAMN05444745_11115 [Arthrobacter sp. OV608]
MNFCNNGKPCRGNNRCGSTLRLYWSRYGNDGFTLTMDLPRQTGQGPFYAGTVAHYLTSDATTRSVLFAVDTNQPWDRPSQTTFCSPGRHHRFRRGRGVGVPEQRQRHLPKPQRKWWTTSPTAPAAGGSKNTPGSWPTLGESKKHPQSGARLSILNATVALPCRATGPSHISGFLCVARPMRDTSYSSSIGYYLLLVHRQHRPAEHRAFHPDPSLQNQKAPLGRA